MSRLLSELLAAEEPTFGLAIKHLEDASGNASVDVRLTAEIVGKVHTKIRALGLDPKDTTGAELYNALCNLVQRHDTFLAARIGIDDSADVQAILPRIKETVEALAVPKKVWVLKHSVAKRLLKDMPPKQVMKQLGYRSVDSMIKREPIAELYGALRFVESADWLSKFVRSYDTLKPTDFETRDVEILQLDAGKWGSAAEQYVQSKQQNITHLKELGVVALLPLPISRLNGLTIVLLPLLLHYINEIRLYSSYFKSQQIHADFSKVLINTLLEDTGKHARIGGQHIHWRTIHRHFGSKPGSHPDIFEPHVEPEDLTWRKAEEALYRLEPALHFWYDMDYCGVMFDGQQVSFNLTDIAVSQVNKVRFGQHSVQHMQNSLWNEIYLRYMGEQAIENQVLAQLSSDENGDGLL